MSSATSGTVLLLTADLATSSKVAGAAARQGIALEVAFNVDALQEKLSQARPTLVIFDLTTPRVDLSAILAQWQSRAEPRPRTIAFGPHVHEALLAAAQQAGCDQVLSRGQFHARVDEILRASPAES